MFESHLEQSTFSLDLLDAISHSHLTFCSKGVLLEGPWEKKNRKLDILMVQREFPNINALRNGSVMKQHRVQNPAEQLLELKAFT